MKTTTLPAASIALCLTQIAYPSETCGTLADAVSYPAGSPTSIATGDFDGDQHLDLVVTNGERRGVSILLSLGDGTFAEFIQYPAHAPVHVGVGDVDGDGDEDLVIANDVGPAISVLLNNGDATFAVEVQYDAGIAPRAIAMGDLDGDLDLDLAVANGGSDDTSVLLNNGDGTFAAEARHAVGAEPRFVVLGDFDGDHDLDLAAPNHLGDDVSVLLNNGDGTFSPETCYDAGFYPEWAAVGDVDGDLDLDLVVANGGICDGFGCFFANVSILLNDGKGAFALDANYDTGGQPVAIAVGDIDQDLDTDVVVTNRSSSVHNDDLAVLLNDGAATFTQAAHHVIGPTSMGLTIADFDDDGDLDVATANSGSDDVSVLLNICRSRCTTDLDGSGDVGLADLATVLGAWGPCDRCLADVDGGGDVGFTDLLMILTTWGACR